MEIFCVICQENLKSTDELCRTQCGHVFHALCIVDWLNRSNTCPECRGHVVKSDIKRIYLNFSRSENSFIDAMVTNHQKELDNLQAQLLQKDQLIQESITLREADRKKWMSDQAQERGVHNRLKNELTYLTMQINIANEILEERGNSERKLQKSLDAVTLEKDTLIKHVKEFNEAMKFRFFAMFPGTNDFDGLMENVAIMKSALESSQIRCAKLMEKEPILRQQFEKEVAAFAKERIVMQERISKLEKMNKSADWTAVAEIFSGTDDPVAISENIAGMKRELTSTTERCKKLEKSEAECSKRFLTERTKSREIEKLLSTVMREKVELQARLAELNENLKSQENRVEPKTTKNVPKTKNAKVDKKSKGISHVSRAPLSSIDQSKENPSQPCHYNLRPR